ncbi:MAG: DUF4440 domain-containing protein [Deltaproteobacteria bacterium]|jgi:murein L,D-transpeptidase YafK|nr:DUF4440 domain-containing protein [Deltaproteobacteria bacterium]
MTLTRIPGPTLAAALALAAACAFCLLFPEALTAQPSASAGGGALSQAPPGWLPDSLLDPGGRPGIILVVDKGRQELQIYLHDGRGTVTLEKVIPCSTGMIRGDKLERGDKKTPDGFYLFNQKLLPSELPEIYGVLAYPMDYPNFWDRIRGHGGDGIWTHGINKPLVDYDSNGCVELFNHDIAALEDRIILYETPILVYEEVRYASPEALREEAARARSFVEAWRAAWAGKDHESYAAMYSEDFVSSDGMSRDPWLSHKRNVAAGYRSIQVEVDSLRIFRHREVTVAEFFQRYRGDSRYTSAGIKRLYLRPAAGSYQIAAEEFIGERTQEPDKLLDPEIKLAALTTPPLSVASFATPLAAAGAGAILPGAPAVAVSASREAGAADSTRDELERRALEAKARRDSPGARPGLGAEEGPEAPQGTPAASGAAERAPGPPEPAAPAGPASPDAPVSPDAPAAPETPIITASLDRRSSAGTTASDAGSSAVPGAASSGAETQAAVSEAREAPGASAPPSQSGPRMSSRSAGPEDAARNPTVTGSLSEPSPEQGTQTLSGLLLADNSGAPGASRSTASSASSAEASAPAAWASSAPAPAADASSASAPAAGVSAPDEASDRAALAELLAGWMAAWEEKDLDKYFGYYARDFRFLDRDMGLEAFKAYRARLIRGAGVINVEMEGPRFRITGDGARVTFVQRYSSDGYSDSGEKTLTFARRDGLWKIVSETFRVTGRRG